MSQVVIVGAGPTGSALALLLAQRGIQVTLIEAAQEFRRVFRGEGLMPSGLDALAQMGMLESLQTIPTSPLTAWEFIVEGRSLFRVDEPMGADRPCTLVAQPPLLEALVAKAQTYPNFTFIQGVAVKGMLWNEGSTAQKRVTGVLLADGRSLPASLVIGADGRSSIVRQRVGLQLVSQPKSMDVLWFKLPAHSRLVDNNTFYSIVNHRKVFSIFHSATQGEMHLAWVLYPDEPLSSMAQPSSSPQWAEVFASLAPEWLARHFQTHQDDISSPIRLSVMVGRCPRWHSPGVLLLGDAAHPMSPVRAQGINMALRDVIVAANHLVPILASEQVALADGRVSPHDEHWAHIDQAIAAIQSEREPEIIRAQSLQDAEAKRGELLRSNRIARMLILKGAPLLGPLIKQSWVHKQQQLRQGITPVKLTV